MRRTLFVLVSLAIVGVVAYAYRAPLRSFSEHMYAAYAPCERPITYTIGSFDTRFGISRSDFLSAIREAEAIWEKAAGRQLFSYEENGDLKINLVYDYRQQTTAKLRSLGLAVDDTRSSYDAVKAKYESLSVSYERQKAAFGARVAALNVRQDAYNKEVSYWNGQGGAPRTEYVRLNDEKNALNAEAAQLQTEQDALNAEVDDINALVSRLNQLATVLNLDVSKYNTIGRSGGAEFEEAVFESTAVSRDISVYQFDSHARLVRVLAHELGHALGLEHVDDPRAIMYRLNQSLNEKPTAADTAELTQQCGLRQ